MSGTGDTELTGALAPPMANGEVVFEAPWQGRVFGMARALAEAGVYDWEEFRACLIEEIADWERDGAAGAAAGYAYYDRFLRAFERLLERKRLVSPTTLGERVAVLGARPHGHDHS